MKIAFNTENLGHALTALANQLDCRIPLEHLAATIQIAVDKDDLSQLSRDEARKALVQISAFPDQRQIDDLLLSQFDFPEETKAKREVSTKPDPFFKKGFSNSSLLMKQNRIGLELENLLKLRLDPEKQAKLIQLCNDSQTGAFASSFANYLLNDLRCFSESTLKPIVIDNLKSLSQNRYDLNFYNQVFNELKTFRESLIDSDPVVEKTLRLLSHLLHQIFATDQDGTKMSLVRDPDLAEGAPYLDLASGILSVQFVNTFFSDQNDRTFYINDNSNFIKRFLEIFQEEWGVCFEPRVKLISHDIKEFDKDLDPESIGTIRVSNIDTFCEEAQYDRLFDQANRILMPNGKIVLCMRHHDNFKGAGEINIDNFREAKFKIKGYDHIYRSPKFQRLVNKLLNEAKEHGWEVKIGSTTGKDHHFEEGKTGVFYNDNKSRTTDIIFIKPAA